MNELASRYANALFALASEENKIKQWQEEVKILLNLLNENKDFIDLLNSEQISFEEKENIIDETFKVFSNEIIDLMKIIILRHRCNYLIDVFFEFNSICNLHFGIKEGLLISSSKLNDAQIEKIRTAISKKEGFDIDFKIKIDPSLIGGFKVVINNHVYDASLNSKIENMKNDLLR